MGQISEGVCTGRLHTEFRFDSIGMSTLKFKRGDIYHRIAARGNYTLCGLKVSRISVGGVNPGDTSEQVPPSDEAELLCKHCERIERQEPTG